MLAFVRHIDNRYVGKLVTVHSVAYGTAQCDRNGTPFTLWYGHLRLPGGDVLPYNYVEAE